MSAKMEEAGNRIQAERPLCALITGASSGIGQAFARLMASKSFDVVVVARRGELLEELKAELEAEHPIKVTPIVQDLGVPEGPRAVMDEVEAAGIEIDILVNNAGYTMDGHFLSYDYEEHRKVQQLMALTPAELTYLTLPGMLRRGYGRNIGTGSAAGLVPSTPFNCMYGACKNHMMALYRSLQIEYGQAGIQFSIVAPGPVKDTQILESQHGKAWARFEWILSDLDDVVERAWESNLKGRMITPIGALSKGPAMTGRLLPTDFFSKASAQGVMFLGKEKPITSAADAGVE